MSDSTYESIYDSVYRSLLDAWHGQSGQLTGEAMWQVIREHARLRGVSNPCIRRTADAVVDMSDPLSPYGALLYEARGLKRQLTTER